MTPSHPSVLLVAASLLCLTAISILTGLHDSVPVILPYAATGFAAGAGVAIPNGPTPPAA